MKITVKSDGNWYDTHIYLNGVELKNCTQFDYTCNPEKGLNEVTLVLDDVALEFVADNQKPHKEENILFLTGEDG